MDPENLRGELEVNGAVEVVVPSDSRYDEARAVWNGTIDRRPAAVARCRSAQGVAHAVRVAVERALPLVVRGGGHSLPGFSTCDGGIVVDVSPMRGVEVDVEARVARAGGGCRWSDYDATTAAHGLASTGGVVSSTGVAGLTLGGGIGWLMNQQGLACDNLIGAQVVLSDGNVVETSDPAHADLLWGLRGGGGNFGVVTRLDFRVSPVDDVAGGVAFYHPDRLEEIARAYRGLVASLSDPFTTMLVLGPAPEEEFVPSGMRGALCAAVVGCSVADPAEAEAELDLVGKLDPVVDLFDRMPYPVMQSLFDAEFPAGGRYYFKGGFLTAFSDGAMEAVIDHMRMRPSAASEFDLHHMSGAVHRVTEMDTSFSSRSANFTYNIVAKWQDPADDDANRDWARSLAAALQPYGEGRGFVSFLSEQSDARSVEAAYGDERYRRLVELKRRYDPHNVFRLNQNVRPPE
jgi:FAD/FMN-containing dehydrogenase